jgi:predicted RNA-binding Zn ribbon-like protein
MSGQTGRRFYFVGERLCLDFVNTEIVESGRSVGLLGGFDDLTAWCAAAHVISARQAGEMTQRWHGTRDAERAFTNAIQFRVTLRRMAERIASGRTSFEQAILDRINGVLHTRAGDLIVLRSKQGYETRFRLHFGEPVHLLVPIAESAANLLSTDDLGLVKKCQNPACVLYFYDTTKNHARRWCSMTACGNRAKVAAHYRRKRQDATAG